jgi:hypothetical protein
VGLLATLTSTTTAVAAFAVVALLIALTVAAPHSRSSRPAATRSLVGAGADRR